MGRQQPMAVPGKAFIADRTVGRGQVIKQHFPAVLLVAIFRRIGGDGQQPGLEAGAALKPRQVAHHGQPGILHGFVGLAVADNGIGHGTHSALIGFDQLFIGLLLTSQQTLKQCRLVNRSHPCLVHRFPEKSD
ncbi:hypothetical protein D9M73_213950 [compost metagenome]